MFVGMLIGARVSNGDLRRIVASTSRVTLAAKSLGASLKMVGENGS
jgi:hypothetical protein